MSASSAARVGATVIEVQTLDVTITSTKVSNAVIDRQRLDCYQFSTRSSRITHSTVVSLLIGWVGISFQRKCNRAAHIGSEMEVPGPE